MRYWRVLASCVLLLIAWVPIVSADDEVVPGSQGGSYSLNMNGDQVASVTNDDGSVIQYHYDLSGNPSGMTVIVGGVSLSLNYGAGESGGGWVYAAPLPPLFHTADAHGRTVAATLYPGMWMDNGEWEFDTNAPPAIPVASFVYGESGHVSAVTLSNGLSMQLQTTLESDGSPPWGTPATPSELVSQTVYGSDGTLLASASPAGGTNAMRVAPTQLDAVATQLGLGANWAETLTFTRSANGQLTTVRNWTTGEVKLYLVDVGEFRVGYTPSGTPVFYDFTPNYSAAEEFEADPSIKVAGVAPTQIVMTADGAAGMYNDRPAEGAVYGVWNDAAGVAHFGRLTTEPASSGRMASQSLRAGKMRVNSYKRYTATVCADGQCWNTVWFEYVDDYGGGGGGGGGGGTLPPTGPPAGGGSSPGQKGNQVKDSKLHASVDRALKKAKEKLQNPTCLALFNRNGTVPGETAKPLIDVMRDRKYTDPGAYLMKYLTYVGGDSTDCAGFVQARTKVGQSSVAVCGTFLSSSTSDGWNAVYLIHEMMHSLGQGENPPMAGQPTSAQLNQQVSAACGH